jgi:uncharacterized protein (TIGR02594 family)
LVHSVGEADARPLQNPEGLQADQSAESPLTTEFSARRRHRHYSYRYQSRHYATYRGGYRQHARRSSYRYVRHVRNTAYHVMAKRRSRVAAAQEPSAMFTGVGVGMGVSDVVSTARRYLGTNPTGRSSTWCGHFMNLVLERTGRRPSPSNTARSFASYGHRVPGPQIGAIAVMARRGGGHVGVVSGIDANGNPIIISGNHNRRVAEATYPRGRIYAYVMP